MSFMPKQTKIDNFKRQFHLSERFSGETANSLDEVINFFNNKFPELNFHKPKTYLNETLRGYFSNHVNFEYVTATIGKVGNRMHLGFKLPEEDFFRIGAPYVEESSDTVGALATMSDCIKLYESPEKKVHIGTQFD